MEALGFAALLVLFPALARYCSSLRYPTLLLLTCAVAYVLIWNSANSTNDWVRPTILWIVMPIVIGFAASEIMLQQDHKQTARKQ